MEVALSHSLPAAKSPAKRRVPEKSNILRHLDSARRIADLHGLRIMFSSRVAASGAMLKHEMEFALHSDPKLTMKTYAWMGPTNLVSVIDGMSTTRKAALRRVESVRKTGTEDGHSQSESGIQAQRRAGRNLTKWCETDSPVPN
jgi:hypothetical protein